MCLLSTEIGNSLVTADTVINLKCVYQIKKKLDKKNEQLIDWF